MKKILFLLVVCISSFMIYTNNVKALVYSGYQHFTDNYIYCSSGYSYCDENLSLFLNKTGGSTLTGHITFNFVSDPQIIVNQVMLFNSNNSGFVCQIGSETIYSDNTTGYHLFTAVCPVSITDGGINRIRFIYDDQYINQNNFKFYIGDFYSFYVDLNGQDYTTLLNNINSNITSMNTNLGGKLNVTNQTIGYIYNQVTNTNTKLEDIKSKLDSLNSASTNISNNTEQIKNDIKSENVSGAEGSADDLKNNSAFQDNTGLSGVISMPLTFVNSLTNTCQPINLNIPYMDVDVTIPCMQSVITDKMPLLANLIKIIVNGFIVYRILLDIFQIVRNSKNPEDDRIEVLDL